MNTEHSVVPAGSVCVHRVDPIAKTRLVASAILSLWSGLMAADHGGGLPSAKERSCPESLAVHVQVEELNRKVGPFKNAWRHF